MSVYCWAVEFRILGPPEAITPEGPIRLTGRRQRAVLAVLLVNADRVVPLDYLVDAVWDDRPPATARRQVQNTVAALRRLLGTDATGAPVIVVEGAGYRIRPGPGALDARVFADRVAEALDLAGRERAAEAAGLLRSALRLWRGPALAGLSGPVIENAAAKLEEERLAAIGHRIDLDLALGNERAVVGELTEFVSAHPLRERFVGQLMQALHATGRQAEALASYQRVRARLADELGVDPGPQLQALHGAILRNDLPAGSRPRVAGPETGTAAPTPALLPPDVAGFTGRADELKYLDELLDPGPEPATVVIAALSGAAGVGKTALAVHWAHRVAHRFGDGQLYVNLRGFDPGGAPLSTAEAVRVFLDALGVPAERIPAGADARVNLYRSLLAGRRMLVVLDNAAGAEQVRPLLPGAPGYLVLVTSRNRMAGLVAAEGAHPLLLDLLSPDEARELLAGRLGPARVAAEPQATRDIVMHCAGLPLALAVAAARVATQSSLPLVALATELGDFRRRLDTLDGGDPATDVRAVISWSYHRLSEPAARLFRLLGLHPGPHVTLPAAASLLGVPTVRVRSLLDELVRVYLIEPASPGRFALHDLLRAYATELAHSEEPEGDRHAVLRRMLDHCLHTAHRAEQLLNPHVEPVSIARSPGVSTAPFVDPGQALEWFTAEHAVLMRVLRLAARGGFDRRLCRLAGALSTFLLHRGHYQDQVTSQRAGLLAARRLGDLRQQAYAHRDLGRVYLRLGDPDRAQHHFAGALALLDELGDGPGRAVIHISLCSVFELRDRYAEALHHAREGLALARTAEHEVAIADALNAVGWCQAQLGEHTEALVHCRQALAVCRRLGNRYGVAAALDSLGFAHHGLGDHRRAAVCYRQAVDRYREIGDRRGEADVLAHLGDANEAAGEHGAARAARQQALSILDDLGHPDAERIRAALAGR